MHYLIITVDTEEDTWGDYNSPRHTTENIKKIPKLQELFDKYEVKPTYLVTYPVATDEYSISILKEIAKSGRCEIGTHPHPWNTPPFEEDKTERNSMLCNLQADLQFKKIEMLHNTIRDNFEIEPVSFRSGRWAFDECVAKNLIILGYKIDTSITPYMDWSSIYGPDFSSYPPDPHIYYLQNKEGDPLSGGELLEIPATIGFLQKNFGISQQIHKASTFQQIRFLRLAGLLGKLKFVNKVFLSPESSCSEELIELAKTMMINKYKFLNMFFHSPSLNCGLTPFVKTKYDEQKILERIENFLAFSRNWGLISIKLSDSVDIIDNIDRTIEIKF